MRTFFLASETTGIDMAPTHISGLVSPRQTRMARTFIVDEVINDQANE
ncbi:hypothetical protein PFI31113_02238 [Pandoraea fibrosis]|uniref:Uncharacterized protein n=1 Tax=Pandoraea fibrosis TaxID=1891094 RepID=A0A5E4UVM3_9BURK|nr:hypothetical protein PFI31113_02238 [Pandoraea fibrosis]